MMMKFSDGEKLIAIMLADLLEAGKVDGEINPFFVREALTSGNLWALKWQYPGIYHDEETPEAVVQETIEILDMCRVIESSIEQLSATDQASINPHDRKVFVGFDANEDSHYGVAKMLIEKLDRWSEFKGRPLNSHSMVMHRYSARLAAYDAAGGASSSPFDLDEIQKILDS